MECSTLTSGEWFVTFESLVMVPQSSKMSGTTHPLKQHHTPKDLDPMLQLLQFHVYISGSLICKKYLYIIACNNFNSALLNENILAWRYI